MATPHTDKANPTQNPNKKPRKKAKKKKEPVPSKWVGGVNKTLQRRWNGEPMNLITKIWSRILLRTPWIETITRKTKKMQGCVRGDEELGRGRARDARLFCTWKKKKKKLRGYVNSRYDMTTWGSSFILIFHIYFYLFIFFYFFTFIKLQKKMVINQLQNYICVKRFPVHGAQYFCVHGV